MIKTLEFDDLKSFLAVNQLLDEDRLTLIFLFASRCKEYGRMTVSEIERGYAYLQIKASDTLKAALQAKEFQIDMDPQSLCSLYNFAIGLYSFGHNSLDPEVFMSCFISHMEHSLES